MKRIHVENEFTQWAEYLARYFGHDLFIYDTNGDLMWGEPTPFHEDIADLKANPYVIPVCKEIGQPIAYLNWDNLTRSEIQILETIVPFIESQLDDEGA